MGEVTRAEFDQLCATVEETYWLTRAGEVAERRREDVAALRGIGRASLAKLQKAMAQRGLSFAEAV
jgi:DNA-directed RNA polymerase alpha subunit